MFIIKLKNSKSFPCDSNTTIFEAAKSNGIFLEHSCLTARCRSCVVHVEEGLTKDRLHDLVLTREEKSNNWVLSCNAMPSSDLYLDVEDLGVSKFFDKKIIPAKIQSIRKLNESVIEVCLRLPPNSNFSYNPGQYVNIIKRNLKRSYSIANAFSETGALIFLIKKHKNGEMSNYWFQEAKENDLLRIEGPIGSFFLRESEAEHIIFLSTGTGLAPIKAILESMTETLKKSSNKKYWLFSGARYEEDLFWYPKELTGISNFDYIPVLSRAFEDWKGEKGYVQDILIKQNLPLENAQVYACGSSTMIESAKKLLIEKGLNENNFFSDAFVVTN
jgi:CDP-4-dehydro-6-deoxyglucose reductase